MNDGPTHLSENRRKTAIITGAAGGLGQVLVRVFLDKGWHILAFWHLTAPLIQHPRLTYIQIDLQDPDAIEAAFNSIKSSGQTIDLLINNAGITRDEPIWKMKNPSWSTTLSINLDAAFYCCKAVSSIMKNQASGHMIQISSFAAKNGHSGQVNYVAAKAALIGMSQSLAAELAPHNIRVNCVLPGIMASAMTDSLSPDQLKRMVESNVLKTINDPVEVAGFIAHLAEMKHVSGQVFQLDSRISKWT